VLSAAARGITRRLGGARANQKGPLIE
jgi:hypothetical protein